MNTKRKKKVKKVQSLMERVKLKLVREALEKYTDLPRPQQIAATAKEVGFTKIWIYDLIRRHPRELRAGAKRQATKRTAAARGR